MWYGWHLKGPFMGPSMQLRQGKFGRVASGQRIPNLGVVNILWETNMTIGKAIEKWERHRKTHWENGGKHPLVT